MKHVARAARSLAIATTSSSSSRLGPADRGGLEIGMVITDAAGRKVANLVEFREALANRPAGRDLLVRILKGAKAEFRVKTADDRWVWLEALATNHLGDAAVAGVVVNIRDITERREVETQFRATRALLEATGILARIGGYSRVGARHRDAVEAVR